MGLPRLGSPVGTAYGVPAERGQKGIAMYARLMTDMEDYQARGINPKRMEDWEEARRSPHAAGSWEVWDFDAAVDDGSLLRLRVGTKRPDSVRSSKDSPYVDLTWLRQDGTVVRAWRDFQPVECTWDESALGVHYDDCDIAGTLKFITLDIAGLVPDDTEGMEGNAVTVNDTGAADGVTDDNADATDAEKADADTKTTSKTAIETITEAEGTDSDATAPVTDDEDGLETDGDDDAGTVSVRLTLTSQARPVRPATGILDVGHDGKSCLGWTCPMPLAAMTGTITVDGKTQRVSATARHTHVWGTVPPTQALNDWMLASQNFGDRTVTLFDATSAAKSGCIRFPIVFVTNKRGNLIYSSTLDTACAEEVGDWYDDPETGQRFPLKVSYTFDTPEGGTIRYTLDGGDPLEAPRTITCGASRLGLKKLSYALAGFEATGTLEVTAPGRRRAGASVRVTAQGRVTVRPGDANADDGSDGGRAGGSGADNGGETDNYTDSYDGADLHMNTTTRTGHTQFLCALAGKGFDADHAPQISTEYAF